jgi:putative CocE/NonD family hydrolase
MVPMRDGVRIYTAVYLPKDTSRVYPFLLERTPYSVGNYGPDHYRARLGCDHFMPEDTHDYAKEGFIFVYQDVRGRFMSEGKWLEMTPHIPAKNGPEDVDESSDTYDTIEWLLENIPNHNGRVGMWGISYMGFYAAAGMIDAHPALKAVSPQAPVMDLYLGDDSFHNGAFMLAANFSFYSRFYQRLGPPAPPSAEAPINWGTTDGYQFLLDMGPLSNSNMKYIKGNHLWDDQLIHTTYDEFWRSRALQYHLKNIRPAVMTVGGWFDAEDPIGPFYSFYETEKNNPRSENILVMGPWRHVQWNSGPGDRLGNLRFHVDTTKWFREKLQMPFFLHYLKGGGEGRFAKAYIFETGSNRWREFDKWPPQGMSKSRVYLAEEGKLSWTQDSNQVTEGFDEFLSDPNKPVPYLPYTYFGMAGDYQTEDQRFASQRPDVLVYQSDILEGDVTIAGPIGVDLYVSTTGTDADFIVKLIDVYPGDFPDNDVPSSQQDQHEVDRLASRIKKGGYQHMVRGEPFRGKFRNSFERPEPFEPGKVERISFEMPDVSHNFRRGHRIMIQVQSSWFPLIDRNPQKFVDIPSAELSDFQKQNHRVWRTGKTASAVTLPILSR